MYCCHHAPCSYYVKYNLLMSFILFFSLFVSALATEIQILETPHQDEQGPPEEDNTDNAHDGDNHGDDATGHDNASRGFQGTGDKNIAILIPLHKDVGAHRKDNCTKGLLTLEGKKKVMKSSIYE